MSIASGIVEMDQVAPYARVESRRASWAVAAAWAVTLIATLAAYAGLLSLYYAPAIIHPDANGYWAQGSLISQTGHSWFTPESDAQYVGMHWLLNGENTFVSRYPPGFPLVVGLVQHFFGWQASVLVNPALAILTLAGVYLILQRLASPAWGIVAIIALAVNPAFTVHALTQISHMAVAFCVVWGFYFLVRWSDSRRVIDIFAAGLVLGCIPSTRYADAIVALGVGLFVLLHLRSVPKLWKHLAWAFGGAMIPILPLLVRNQLLFGAFWRTGYALTNEQTGFSWQNFLDHSIPYLQMLQSGGLGMMFALGVIGMIWMLFVPRTRAISILFLASAIPFLFVYMAYYWAMGVGNAGMGGNVGGAMRFLVPIVPLFVIAGAWVMSQAMVTTPLTARIVIPLAVIAMQVLMFGSSLREELRRSFDSKSVLAITTRELEQAAPAGSVIVADTSLLQQLDFVRKWKLADASTLNPRRGPGGGRPGILNAIPGFGGDDDLPSPQQQAKIDARATLYTGSDRDKQLKFERDINAWAGTGEIFVVGKEADLSRLLPLAKTNEFEVIRRFSTPKPPEPPAQVNPMSRMGRGGPGGRNMRRGGPFGAFAQPGEEIVIARWVG
jgi:hypothetical protein